MKPRMLVLTSAITLIAVLAVPVGWAAQEPQQGPETVSSVDTAVTSNPVPLINQPLVPDARRPGGTAFVLTVRHGVCLGLGREVERQRARHHLCEPIAAKGDYPLLGHRHASHGFCEGGQSQPERRQVECGLLPHYRAHLLRLAQPVRLHHGFRASLARNGRFQR